MAIPTFSQSTTTSTRSLVDDATSDVTSQSADVIVQPATVDLFTLPSSSTPQPVFETTVSSASTSSALDPTPLSPSPTPQSLLLTAAASSVVTPPGPNKTSASVTASGSSGLPSSPASKQGPESTGLSSAAKVGIGLGVPLGILLCVIIAFFLLRYYRSKISRGTSPRELYFDTEEKVKGESPRVQEIRDDGVVRKLY